MPTTPLPPMPPTTDGADRSSYLDAVLDTVVDGIITIDEHGTIQTVNRATLEIFGHDHDELIGRNVNVLMPASYAREHDGYVGNYRRTGHAKIIGIGREVEGRRKDGSTFPMELAVAEMTERGHRHFVGIIRDVTERKRVERMKAEFVSTVSHELRTPLTTLRGAVEMALDAVEDPTTEVHRLLEMASRNAERLVLLIADLLDVERIGSGHLELAFATVDLARLSVETVADMGASAAARPVRLGVTSSVASAPVRADAHRIVQVLANLLSNAIKFAPPDTEVTVAVSGTERGFRVSVRDEGRGIPPAFRSQIFQRFAQADSSDTRELGGAGLGLYISRGIVEAHGGTLDFDADRSVGSEFFFELPAHVTGFDEDPATADATADASLAHGAAV